MITSVTDRAFLRGQFPELTFRGLTGSALDRAIDVWYADDHFSSNPAYEPYESDSDAIQ